MFPVFNNSLRIHNRHGVRIRRGSHHSHDSHGDGILHSDDHIHVHNHNCGHSCDDHIHHSHHSDDNLERFPGLRQPPILCVDYLQAPLHLEHAGPLKSGINFQKTYYGWERKKHLFVDPWPKQQEGRERCKQRFSFFKSWARDLPATLALACFSINWWQLLERHHF